MKNFIFALLACLVAMTFGCTIKYTDVTINNEAEEDSIIEQTIRAEGVEWESSTEQDAQNDMPDATLDASEIVKKSLASESTADESEDVDEVVDEQGGEDTEQEPSLSSMDGKIIWKPASEGTGNLVVIVKGEDQFAKVQIVREGEVVETGDYSHMYSGWPCFYFNLPGAAYEPCILSVDGKLYEVEDAGKYYREGL